jgi:A1 cistron-splicing factor AAR2
LTHAITPAVLERIMGQQNPVDMWLVNTADNVRGAILDNYELKLENSLAVKPLLHLQTRSLNFAFGQATKTFSLQATGADRTRDAMDATFFVESLLNDPSKGITEDQIVGEFQFAYLVAVNLGNAACLQQWWHILHKIFLHAFDLPSRRPGLAAKIFRSLAAQLFHSNELLEDSILSHDESYKKPLRLALTTYKRRLDDLIAGNPESPALTDAGIAFSKVEQAVADLGWDLDANYLRKGQVMTEDGDFLNVEVEDLEDEDERGEYAPQVVDVDEDGRPRDFVSWTN